MNESGLLPIEDRVLVKLIDAEEKSVGGIVIPKAARDAEDMASIHGYYIDAGEEGTARMTKHHIRPNDLIVFAKYSGLVYIGKDGLRYRIMNAADVIAKSAGVFDTSMRARKPIPLPEAA